LPEAAQILKTTPEVLRKTVDRGWLAKSYVQVGGRKIRALDGLDIVCLYMSDTVSSKVRQGLYVRLKDLPEDLRLAGTMQLEIAAASGSGSRTVDVSLDRPVHEALAGIDALDRSVQAVDVDGVIVGGGVEAHRIAALVNGGMAVAEVLEDYPSLNEDQVAAAVAYAKVNPKHGRPYPVRSVKAVLRKGRGGLARAFADALCEDGT